MITRRIYCFLLPLPLLLAGCGGGSHKSSLPSGAEQRSAEQITRAVRQKYNLPALGVAVIRSDGSPTVLAVDGVRQFGKTATVSPNDRWHIGSCTKAITATMIAVLVAEGKLTWETKPANVLPELRGKLNADYANATLRQILLMRAGLPGVETLDEINALPPFSGSAMQQRRAATTYFLENPAPNKSGSIAYSNASLVIAATMAEAVTGNSWENLIRYRVLKPIGADGSLKIGWPAKGDANAIYGHIVEGNGFAPHNDNNPAEQIPALFAPAGDISLNLRDWAKWAQADLRGQRGLSTALPASVWQAVHQGEPIGDGSYLSLGWLEANVKGRKTSLFTGSADTFYATISIQPDQDQAILLVTNSATEKTETEFAEVNDALNEIANVSATIHGFL